MKHLAILFISWMNDPQNSRNMLARIELSIPSPVPFAQRNQEQDFKEKKVFKNSCCQLP